MDDSRVELPATKDTPREVISTRTDGEFAEDGFFVLEYERNTYSADDPSTLDQRQLIFYRIKPKQQYLNPGAVSVEPLLIDDRGVAAWIVSIEIQDWADLIRYDNVVEHRNVVGEIEVTRSRGRVRSVALGYFTDHAQAMDLAETFERYLQITTRD